MKVLHLRGEDLNGSHICCTGPQIAMVLQALLTAPELRNCRWYAGAIETYPTFGMYESGQLEVVEDLTSLIERVTLAGQLFDGIIVAIPPAEAPDLRSQMITADGSMDKAVRNSLVEVHAFDTSWVEVYTEMPELIESIQGQLGGKLVDAPL